MRYVARIGFSRSVGQGKSGDLKGKQRRYNFFRIFWRGSRDKKGLRFVQVLLCPTSTILSVSHGSGHPAPIFTTSVRSPGPLVTFEPVSVYALLAVGSSCDSGLFPAHAFEI